MTVAHPVDIRVRTVGALLAAVGAGVLFGALDLFGQHVLPAAFAELANSSAVWAVAAFLFGRVLGPHVVTAAVSGVLFLTVAVEAYYLAAVMAMGDSPSTLTSQTTVLWLVFGVLAGAAFGAAGAVSRFDDDMYAGVAIGFGVSVLFAEAIAMRSGWSILIDVVLGAALLLASAASSKRRLIAMAAVVPCTAFMIYAFDAAGFAIG